MTSSTRIPLMANGTIDLECGSTTNNAERQKQVAFTNTHFLTASRFVSKKSTKLKTVIDDLKGKTVVSTSGTTNIKQLTEANAARNLGINIIPAKDHAEAFLMVETDRAVAFVMDDILLDSLVAGVEGSRRLRHLRADRILQARAVRHHAAQGRSGLQESGRCRDGAAYKRRGIKSSTRNGSCKTIPPKGMNLNVPMSAEFKKVVADPTDTRRSGLVIIRRIRAGAGP